MSQSRSHCSVDTAAVAQLFQKHETHGISSNDNDNSHHTATEPLSYHSRLLLLIIPMVAMLLPLLLLTMVLLGQSYSDSQLTLWLTNRDWAELGSKIANNAAVQLLYIGKNRSLGLSLPLYGCSISNSTESILLTMMMMINCLSIWSLGVVLSFFGGSLNVDGIVVL